MSNFVHITHFIWIRISTFSVYQELQSASPFFSHCVGSTALDISSLLLPPCSLSAFVLSTLDYCNFVIVYLPNCLLDKLQTTHNNPACIVFGEGRLIVSPLLCHLHWLPLPIQDRHTLLSWCSGPNPDQFCLSLLVWQVTSLCPRIIIFGWIALPLCLCLDSEPLSKMSAAI